MKPRSFKAALDGLLLPLGFERDARTWTRQVDGFRDIVDQQVSSIAGTTVNVLSHDLAALAIMAEVTSPGHGIYGAMDPIRVPSRVSGLDTWYHSGGDGPAQLAEVLRVFGLPIFDQMRFLEHRARHMGRFSKRAEMNNRRLHLAITLHRMGKVEEARRVLSNTPANMKEKWTPIIDALRRRLCLREPDCGDVGNLLIP